MKKNANIIWLTIMLMAQPGLVFGENERLEIKETGRDGAPNGTLQPPEKEQQRIDKAHAAACRAVSGAAQWLDSFFDDDTFVEEENRSQVRVSMTTEYTRFDDFTFRPRVHVRLRLPEAEERASLIFSYSDDEEFRLDDDPLSPAQALRTGEDREEMNASLRWFFAESLEKNVSISTGASLNYLYTGLRYRGYYDYGSWQGRLVEQFRYYTDDGFENKLHYDIERQISSYWFFRTSIGVNWFEETNGLPHVLAFSLDQVLSEDKAIRYEWINSFETSPSYRMEDLKLRARYHQRFYRDWLILEIAPEVSFPYEHDREFNPGIVIKLEADFSPSPSFAESNRVFQF